MTTAAIHDDRRLPALTGIRFFAAGAVVLSHFTERGFLPSMPGVVSFLDGGRTAVALFFVLSGFVLAYNYELIGAPGSRRAFYVARVARIYPTALLALALSSIGVAYAYEHAREGLLLEWYSLTSHVQLFLGLSFIGQVLTLVGWLPSASLNQPWNGPAWSISCEMFFYALFPFLMVWIRRQRALVLGSTMVAAFAAQAIWVFVLAPIAPVGQRGFLVSQFPLPHLVEFVCGIVVAIAYSRGARLWLAIGHRRTILLAVSLLPAIGLSIWHPITPAYIPVTPFFALLVLALAVPPKPRRSWLAWAPLLLLGEASFALYLIHIPLLNVASIWPLARGFGWLLLIAVELLSVAVFHFYETPARLLVKRALTSRHRKVRTPHEG